MPSIANLTFEFNADIAPLQKGFQSANTIVKDFVNNLDKDVLKLQGGFLKLADAVEKSFKSIGTSFSGLTDFFKGKQAEIQLINELVKGLNELASASKRTSASLDPLTGRFEKLAQSVDKNLTKVNSSVKSFTGFTVLEKSASTSVENINKAVSDFKGLDKLEGTAKNLATAIQNTTPKFVSFGETVQKSVSAINSAFSGLNQHLYQTANVLNTALSIPLQKIAQSQIAYRDLNERALITFKQLLGTSEAASNLLEDLKRFAVTTPFEFEGLLDSAKQLLAFGVSAERIRPAIVAISDGIAGLGGSGETVNRIVQAFGKLNTNGKLTATIMNQLTSAGIEGWKFLADALGITVEQLRKYTKQGLIPAGIAFDTILVQLEKKFPDFANKFGNTFLSAFSNLSDAFKQLLDAVLLPVLNRLRDLVVGVSNTMLKLKSSFEGISDETKNLLGVLPAVLASLATFLTTAFGLKVAITAIISPIGLLSVAFGAYAYEILSSKEKTEEFTRLISSRLPEIANIVQRAVGVIMVGSFVKLALQIRVVIVEVTTLGLALGTSFATRIGVGLASIGNFSKGLAVASATTVAAAKSTNIAAVSFARLPALFTSFTPIITAFATRVASLIPLVFTPVGAAITGFVVLLLGAFDKYTNLSDALLSNQTNKTQVFINSLGTVWERSKVPISYAITTISFLVEGLTALFGFLLGVVLKVARALFEFVAALTNLARVAISTLSAFNPLIQSLRWFWSSLPEGIKKFTGLANAINYVSSVTGEFQRRVSLTQKGLNSFEGGVKKVGAALGTAFKVGANGLAAPEVKITGEEARLRISHLRGVEAKQLAYVVDLTEKLKTAEGQRYHDLSILSKEAIIALQKTREEITKYNSKIPIAEQQTFDAIEQSRKKQLEDLKKSLTEKSSVRNKAQEEELKAQKAHAAKIEAARKKADQERAQRDQAARNYLNGIGKQIRDLTDDSVRANLEWEIANGVLKGAKKEYIEIARQRTNTLLYLQDQAKIRDYFKGLNDKIKELKNNTSSLNVEYEISNGVLKKANDRQKEQARTLARNIQYLEEQKRIHEEIRNIQNEVRDFDTSADTDNPLEQFIKRFSSGDAAKIPADIKNALIEKQTKNFNEKALNNGISQYYKALADLNKELVYEDTFQGRVNKRLNELLDTYKELYLALDEHRLATLKARIEEQVRLEDNKKIYDEQTANYKRTIEQLNELGVKKKELSEIDKINASIAAGEYDLLRQEQRIALQNAARQADARLKELADSERLLKIKENISEITEKLAEDLRTAKAAYQEVNSGNVSNLELAKTRGLEKYLEVLKQLPPAERAAAEAAIKSNVEQIQYFNDQTTVIKAFNAQVESLDASIKELGGAKVPQSVANFMKVIHDNNILITKDIQDMIDILYDKERLKAKLEEHLKLYNELADGIKGVFESSFKGIFEDGFGSFFKNIEKGFTNLLEDLAAKYLSSLLVQVLTNAFGISFGLGNGLAGRAIGGSVTAGEPYIVGERGSELFIPQTAGNIVPNDKLDTGSRSTTVVMNISTPDANSFRKSQSQILSEMERAMSTQRKRNG